MTKSPKDAGDGPRRVLIIDDNLGLAENIAELLQMHGCLTSVATSAEEAAPLFMKDRPDVVVTDYRLPGISGADFVRQFCHSAASVQAIVISAYTDDNTVGEARQAGARFLAKPVDLTVLSQLIRGPN